MLNKILTYLFWIAAFILLTPLFFIFIVPVIGKVIYPKGIHQIGDTRLAIPKNYFAPASVGPYWRSGGAGGFGSIPINQIIPPNNPHNIPFNAYEDGGFGFDISSGRTGMYFSDKRPSLSDHTATIIDSIWHGECQNTQISFDRNLRLYRLQAICPQSNFELHHILFYDKKPDFNAAVNYNFLFKCTQPLENTKLTHRNYCQMLGQWQDVVYELDFRGDQAPYYWQLRQGLFDVFAKWQEDAK